MYLSRIVFGKRGETRGGEPRAEVAERYLATLLYNGQICGDYLFATCNAEVDAFAHVARPGALARQFHSQWGLASLQEVVRAFGHVPQCRIIEDDVPKRFRSWKRSPSLYLFSHAFNDVSPVRCGDSGSPVPPYLLPISDQLREDLCWWARRYKNLDNVWLDSGDLEVPAYRQLADPGSELSENGRKLCAEIEAATGKETYYYMQRYWGREVGEQDRRCPTCGRRWRATDGKSKDEPFWRFAFRCRPCRLVSHCADSYDDKRHAIIGEYRRRRRPTENLTH